MTDVPCNLVAALVSGVRYSQGSGAYQSSVRNRSKLVVNSVGKPANMLVNQGFGGIIENFTCNNFIKPEKPANTVIPSIR